MREKAGLARSVPGWQWLDIPRLFVVFWREEKASGASKSFSALIWPAAHSSCGGKLLQEKKKKKKRGGAGGCNIVLFPQKWTTIKYKYTKSENMKNILAIFQEKDTGSTIPIITCSGDSECNCSFFSFFNALGCNLGFIWKKKYTAFIFLLSLGLNNGGGEP